MGNFRKILFLSAFTVVCGGQLIGQTGKAAVSIDSTSILIGDHSHLKFSYTFPANAIVKWPVFSDTLSKEIEIVEKGKLDTSFSSDKKNRIFSQVLTITCFDSGYFAIPAVKFMHKMPGDTTNYFSETQPVMLTVNTVAVDTTQAIKDIKTPLKVPWTLREILIWLIIGFVGLVNVAVVIVLIIYRKKKKPLFGRFKPRVPAHIRALQALEELRSSHLWQQGKTKEYHSLLTDIVRTYIEERFMIPAMEMISSDVLESLTGKEEINEENYVHLRRILQLADMVKFAKFTPLPDEHDSSLRYAVQFVNETAPKTEPLKTETTKEETGLINETTDKTENKQL
jgi:hypothetical protein